MRLIVFKTMTCLSRGYTWRVSISIDTNQCYNFSDQLEKDIIWTVVFIIIIKLQHHRLASGRLVASYSEFAYLPPHILFRSQLQKKRTLHNRDEQYDSIQNATWPWKRQYERSRISIAVVREG